MAGEAVERPPRPPFDPSKIRAVAFDAFGTLFDWDFDRSIGDVLGVQGLGGDHEAVAKSFVEASGKVHVWGQVQGSEEEKPARSVIMSGPIPEWISIREIWRRQFELAFAEHKLEGDAEAGADYLRNVLSHAPAYPDAYETIERLAAKGYLLGLLSNADEDFLQSAVSHNRLRFSVIESSESMRAYKPHITVFQALPHRFACEPGEVLYVGDSPQADVWGADFAGLRSAWVRRTESEYPEDVPAPDLEVTSLAAIADALGA